MFPFLSAAADDGILDEEIPLQDDSDESDSDGQAPDDGDLDGSEEMVDAEGEEAVVIDEDFDETNDWVIYQLAENPNGHPHGTPTISGDHSYARQPL